MFKNGDCLFGINENLWNVFVIMPERALNARVGFWKTLTS